MPAKRSRAQIGAAPIQTFFKTRRKASYVSGRTRRAKTKGAAVSVHHKPCDAHSSEEHREESKCFVCDEQLGTVVCCDTAQCNRVAHPACVGLDMELYRQRQRRQGVGQLPSTGVSEGAPSGAGSVSALDESGKFLCDRCTPDSRDGAKYNTLLCALCGSGENDARMLVCDGCDKGFHMYCMTPQLVNVPVGKWFCQLCKPQRDTECDRKFVSIKKSVMADQTSILSFFKVNKKVSSPCTAPLVLSPLSTKKAKRRRAKRFNYNPKSQRQVFRLPVPTPCVTRRVEQLAAVAAAMQAKGIEYADELRYSASASRSMNQASKELGGLQPMTKVNLALFRRFKELTAQGLFAPMMVTNDPLQGFCVVADARIPDRTLLCEYVGDVHLLREQVHGECDSLMELLRTGNPETGLLISPKCTANIARFLSGINNYTAEGRRSQNVRSARFEVDGEARVVLYAARDISKGEVLCYDYNAAQSRYPTQHFV